MKEIQSFTFYKNYYDILKYLKDDEKLLLYNSIMEYIFENKEPVLDGLMLGIWNNIKMPLNTTKNKIINGSKGGLKISKIQVKAKQNGKQNLSKVVSKTEAKDIAKGKANNISISISNFLISISNLVINRLNELNNTKYKADSEETLKLIKGRLDEGYTQEDLLLVVDKMSYLWNREVKKDEKDMRPYLRPSTLFRKSNFENYLNMPVSEEKKTTKDLIEMDDIERFFRE